VRARAHTLQFTNTAYAMSGVKVDTVLRGGRWYFEAKLDQSGSIRVGVCASRFVGAAESELGADAHSWAYDGNGNCYHNGKTVRVWCVCVRAYGSCDTFAQDTVWWWLGLQRRSRRCAR
jgi:hypothetical protein